MTLHTRRLGRTEHRSTVAILGGAMFWNANQQQAEDALGIALARGVNHLDIAPSYGRAEVAVGPLLPSVRERLFITEKTNRSSADGARAQLEASLNTLGCDRFDVYQAHGVTDLDVLEQRVPAIEMMLRARDEGLCDFVGITGHDLGAPRAHLEACRRWDLDTVMFPMYPRVWADPVYRADSTALLEHCAAHDVGVMVIKAVAHQPWGGREKTADSWYEPWADPEHITNGIRFALSTPGVTGFCTPGDMGLLPLVLDAAAAVGADRPLDEAERAAVADDASHWPLIFPIAEHARIG